MNSNVCVQRILDKDRAISLGVVWFCNIEFLLSPNATTSAICISLLRKKIICRAISEKLNFPNVKKMRSS